MYEPRDLDRDEIHMQMLARKTFVVTMVGAVGFLTACLLVLL